MTENVYPEGGLLCLPGESHGQRSLAGYSPKSQILKQLSICLVLREQFRDQMGSLERERSTVTICTDPGLPNASIATLLSVHVGYIEGPPLSWSPQAIKRFKSAPVL